MGAFNASIPQPGDLLSASQGQLLVNFDQINQKWAVNHYGLDPATSNDGKHKYVTLPEQASAPATGADEGAVYTKDVSGSTHLFYRPANNGTELQLSGSSATISGSNGSVGIGSGVVLKWGVATANGTDAFIDVNFVSAGIGNFPANCFSVVLTSSYSGFSFSNQVNVINKATTGFRIFIGGLTPVSGVTFDWHAIGN